MQYPDPYGQTQYEGGGSGGGGSSYGVVLGGASPLAAGFGATRRCLGFVTSGAFGSALAFVVIDAVTEGAGSADAAGAEDVVADADGAAGGEGAGAGALIDGEGDGEGEGGAAFRDARWPS